MINPFAFEKSDKDTYLLSTFFSLKSVAESPTLYPCACKPAKAHNMNTIKEYYVSWG